MTDVVLVLMPYVSVERPSLALGTLRPALLAAGIGTRELYANVRFAREIGLPAYENINGSVLSHRIGEWTFAAAAFPDDDLRPAEYLRGLNGLLGHPPGLSEQLLAVREIAGRFVDRTAEEVLELRPRIVGCSSVFQQQCASLALLRRIRELDPSVVTMLGGGNCEDRMGRAAHRGFEWVDFVVSGEADELLPPLCRAVLEGGRDLPASSLPAGVFGPAHRTGLDRAAPPPASYARARRLDRLPVPDYGEYFAELARSGIEDMVVPGIPFETARGCWWGEKRHCTFCGISDSAMTFRAKSGERVLAELDQLYERYGITRFMAADNIIETSYFDRVLPELAAAGRRYSLFYQTKANLRRRQVALLAAAGVRWIQPGIESLHDGVLRLLVKGASAAINVQLLKWARIYGVWVMWNMLFGAPGEKDEWYAEVAGFLPLLSHLQPPAAADLTAIRYNRFSPYFDHPERYGLDLEPYWAYAYTYPHDAERRAEQAYYFHDKNDAGNSHRPETRPGVRRLNERIEEWASLFFDLTPGPMPKMRPSAPELVVTGDGERWTIRDSRPIAIEAHHRLSAFETRILRCCDAATTPVAIGRALERAGAPASAGEIDAALRSLSERHLIHAFGGRILGLVLDVPPAAYQNRGRFPAGLVLPHRAVARRPAPPPADPVPWDMPLSSVFGVAVEERV